MAASSFGPLPDRSSQKQLRACWQQDGKKMPKEETKEEGPLPTGMITCTLRFSVQGA